MGEKLKAFWSAYVNDKAAAWTAVFTGVLTLCTIGLAWIGYWQNTDSIISQRAFVNYEAIRMTGRVAGQDGHVAFFGFGGEFDNSGTTPALRMHGAVNFLPTGAELEKGYNFPDREVKTMSEMVLGPHSTKVLGPVTVPVHDLEEVRTGHSHLYIYGWMTYNDTFTRERHLTEFCTEAINPRPAQGTDLADPNYPVAVDFIGCPNVSHDCYDKGCQDYSTRITQ